MADVLYVEDLAAKLGKTEASIRNLIQRQGDLPRGYKIGKRWAWNVSTVDRWLFQKEGRRPGRPRGTIKTSEH